MSTAVVTNPRMAILKVTEPLNTHCCYLPNVGGWGFRPQPPRCPPLRGPSRIPNLSCFHTEYLMPYGVGFTMALASDVTAVCASALPFSVAPVFSTIAV